MSLQALRTFPVAYRSFRLLQPVLECMQHEDWFVSIGQVLPDDQGLRIGGAVRPWPSSAHRAIWTAARRGFSNRDYDAVLREHQMDLRVDTWLSTGIVFLAGMRKVPWGREARALRDPHASLIGGSTWHTVWAFDGRRDVFYDPQDPTQVLPIPPGWHQLASDLATLPPDRSLGVWMWDWVRTHEHTVITHPGFHTSLDAALAMLATLLAAMCYYGAGHLDTVPHVAVCHA